MIGDQNSGTQENITPGTTRLSQEVKDPQGRIIGRAEAEFPATQIGNLARVYTTVGIIGFVMIGSMLAFFLMLKSSMDSQRDILEYMQQSVDMNNKRLDRLWDEASKERRDMTDRYISGRELTEKRHGELMAKIDKVMTYIEWTFDRVKAAMPKAKSSNGDLP